MLGSHIPARVPALLMLWVLYCARGESLVNLDEWSGTVRTSPRSPRGQAPSAHFMLRTHLSSKTTYANAPPLDSQLLDPMPMPRQCRAVFLDLLARHGTRYPTSKW